MVLTLTLLRFGFLALLWFFVIIVVKTVRKDSEGMEIRTRDGQRISNRIARRQARTKKREEASAPELSSSPVVSPPQPSPTPLLVVTAGPLTGTALPLGNQDIQIGRAPNNSLILDDSYASSHHARIFNSNGAWWLEDLGSTNGTLLNGNPVRSPLRLHPGAPITIGQTVMEFQL